MRQQAAAARMKDWRFWLAEQRGTLLAVGIFVVMFVIYASNHPAGFTANVVQTASNKGVLLAFVAMAQTLVVHHRRHRSFGRHDLHADQLPRLVDRRRHAVGSDVRRRRRAAGRRPVRRDQRRHRHLSAGCSRSSRPSPPARSISASRWRCGPSRAAASTRHLADALTGRLFGVIPASLVALLAVVLVVWVPFRRSVTGRAAYAAGSSETGGLHVGRADQPGQVRRLYAVRPARRRSAGCSSPSSPIRATPPMRAATPIRCSRSPPWCSAACRCSAARGSAIGAIFGALAFRTIGDLLFVFDFDPLWQPLFQGVVLLVAVSLGAFALFRVRNRLDWFA